MYHRTGSRISHQSLHCSHDNSWSVRLHWFIIQSNTKNLNCFHNYLRLPIHSGRFCLSCKKEAVPSCMTVNCHHPTLSMGFKTAEFCLQLLESKDQNDARLSSIIQTRKEARNYLREVSTAHKLVGEGIRRGREQRSFRPDEFFFRELFHHRRWWNSGIFIPKDRRGQCHARRGSKKN